MVDGLGMRISPESSKGKGSGVEKRLQGADEIPRPLSYRHARCLR